MNLFLFKFYSIFEHNKMFNIFMCHGIVSDSEQLFEFFYTKNETARVAFSESLKSSLS